MKLFPFLKAVVTGAGITLSFWLPDLGAQDKWLDVPGLNFEYSYSLIPAPEGGQFASHPAPASANQCVFYRDIPYPALVPYREDGLIINYVDKDGNSQAGVFNPVSRQSRPLRTSGFKEGSSVFVYSTSAASLSVIEVTGKGKDGFCTFSGVDASLSENTIRMAKVQNEPDLMANASTVVLHSGGHRRLDYSFGLYKSHYLSFVMLIDNMQDKIIKWLTVGDSEGAGYYIYDHASQTVILKQSNTEIMRKVLGNAIGSPVSDIDRDYICSLANTSTSCITPPKSNLPVQYDGINAVSKHYLVRYHDTDRNQDCLYIAAYGEYVIPSGCPIAIPLSDKGHRQHLYKSGISDDGQVAYLLTGERPPEWRLYLSFNDGVAWSKPHDLRLVAPELGADMYAASQINLSFTKSLDSGEYLLMGTAPGSPEGKDSDKVTAFSVTFRHKSRVRFNNE